MTLYRRPLASHAVGQEIGEGQQSGQSRYIGDGELVVRE